MTLDEFVKAFAAEFDDTPEETFKPETHYRELDEWGSLVALSIISMVDDEMDKVKANLGKHPTQKVCVLPFIPKC